jgi:hypothetical protein
LVRLPSLHGTRDNKISIKKIDGKYLKEGLKGWQKGGVIDNEEDQVKLDVKDVDLDIFFKDNAPQ